MHMHKHVYTRWHSGMVCSFLSTFMVSMILIRPVKFALPYTLGALLSLGSTSFLVGPWRQLSSMFDPTRVSLWPVLLCPIEQP